MIKNKLSWLLFSIMLCCMVSLNAAHPSLQVLSGDHSKLQSDFNSKLWSEAVLIEIAYAYEQGTKYRKAPEFLEH